jgi:hypothetical protein
MTGRRGAADARLVTAAVLTTIASRGSSRLLAAVTALDEQRPRPPALTRLEAAVGRELAGRLVSALSAEQSR